MGHEKASEVGLHSAGAVPASVWKIFYSHRRASHVAKEEVRQGSYSKSKAAFLREELREDFPGREQGPAAAQFLFACWRLHTCQQCLAGRIEQNEPSV